MQTGELPAQGQRPQEPGGDDGDDGDEDGDGPTRLPQPGIRAT